MLDQLAHARLRDASSAKDLHSVTGSILRGPGGVHLEETDGSATTVSFG